MGAMADLQVREPARAGSFYPASESACRAAIQTCAAEAGSLPPRLLEWHADGGALYGGIAPHAGWAYSGPCAWLTAAALMRQQRSVATAVIFATTHRREVCVPSVQARGRWKTPLGALEIDAAWAEAFLTACAHSGLPASDSARAHEGDHAIEAVLPFLQAERPDLQFVPIAMPNRVEAPELGAVAARVSAVLGRETVFIASTDLTHYGARYYGWAPKGTGPAAHAWVKEENDRPFLECLERLDAPGAYAWAEQAECACGYAAAAAAASACRHAGATQSLLLQHTTSWERSPDGPPADFVGYASLVWGAAATSSAG
jgi:AmmeMemoRadiSam system protein B